MSFHKDQPRGPDGKWIPTGARKTTRKAKSRANKRKHTTRHKKPMVRTIDRTAARRQRGVGFSGLKQNTIPYLRVSKKSATIGANAGTFIPGTNKRIVIGNYARIESVNKVGKVDSAISKLAQRIAPAGSRRALVGKHIKKNVKLDNPAVRYSTPGTESRHGTEARLGTSRKSGPTLVVRRGTHKRTREQSKSGIKAYNQRMSKIQGKKVTGTRPTRRKQAAARKNRKKRNK